MQKLFLGILLCWVTTSLTTADITSDIDAFFQDYNKPNVPGASVLVIQNSEIIYSRGYGLQNLNPKEETTVHTHYRLASLTKQFTAMGILILVDRGKLSLDTPLTHVFSDFPAYGTRITVRHLLNHTSGLKDYENLIPPSQTEQILDNGVLALMKKQNSGNFTPGSQYQYSNSGYCVLAQIIEKVSGQTFAAFLKENVFVPIGMYSTLVFEKGISQVEHRAYGYTTSGGSFTQTDQSITSATQGDGGVYTSVTELYQWNQALEGHWLISSELQELAFTPGVLNNGSSTQYGFGWTLDRYKGLNRQSHTGSTIGFRTAIQRYPEKKTTIAVLINRANTSPWNIAEKIADRVLITSKKLN